MFMRSCVIAAALMMSFGASANHHQPQERWQNDGRMEYNERWQGAQRSVVGRHVEFSVVEDYGQPLPIYKHRGRNYVAGDDGQRYSLYVTNRSHQRVLVVVSVDGVNVVSGQTASVNQGGYVLEPGQVARIEGWRKSLRDVARFYFTYPEDSYAARTGRDENLGVIGVAVFPEKPRPDMHHYDYGNDVARERGLAKPASAPAPSASAQSKSSVGSAAEASVQAELGTGHGERADSYARTTHFERASSRPSEVLSLRYNTFEQLRAMGVVRSYRYDNRRGDPEPFPERFVPDPVY